MLSDKLKEMIRLNLSKEEAFTYGEKPSLDLVLANREKRVKIQDELCTQYPKKVIIAYKCNIPGEVKNNEVIQYIFNAGREMLMESFKQYNWSYLYQEEFNEITGPELFIVVSEENVFEVKKVMIEIEQNSTLGRLLDVDVLYVSDAGVRSISRTELGFEERKCLLCEHSAKECGRARVHSIEHLHEKMRECLVERGVYFNE